MNEKKQLELLYEKKLNSETIRRIIKMLNSESLPLYMEVRDENNNLVGFKRLIQKNHKQTKINSLLKRIHFLDDYITLTNYFKVNKLIQKVEDELEEVECAETYVMAMDGDEEYKSAIKDMEIDIANIARTKSYRLQR